MMYLQTCPIRSADVFVSSVANKTYINFTTMYDDVCDWMKMALCKDLFIFAVLTTECCKKGEKTFIHPHMECFECFEMDS